MSEAALIRFLFNSYEPREKPDDRFYDAMNLINDFAGSLELMSYKASGEQRKMLEVEIERWHQFQADIENEFLRPGRSKLKWQ